ncbi:NAD(P)-binding domain-containing protein [Streptomyces diastatochromogenes]|nr:NAD(P)-binding domain-containing protein [Streptomyces diastatochromogenes]
MTVWNRTAAKADALVADGAVRAASPAEAVRDADVVVTMLADPAAALAVADEMLPRCAPAPTGSTPRRSGRTPSPPRRPAPRRVTLVDAPVMGSVDRPPPES